MRVNEKFLTKFRWMFIGEKNGETTIFVFYPSRAGEGRLLSRNIVKNVIDLRRIARNYMFKYSIPKENVIHTSEELARYFRIKKTENIEVLSKYQKILAEEGYLGEGTSLESTKDPKGNSDKGDEKDASSTNEATSSTDGARSEVPELKTRLSIKGAKQVN